MWIVPITRNVVGPVFPKEERAPVLIPVRLPTYPVLTMTTASAYGSAVSSLDMIAVFVVLHPWIVLSHAIQQVIVMGE